MGSTSESDIQLKFEGVPVERLGGAPADAVANSLLALQRLVHLIGMKSEGRAFGQRVKPSARVRREYAVICRAPQQGSHIQPFGVEAASGATSAAAVVARETLLRTLKAFDSGDDETLQRIIPNARERWFMADAAAGLLPSAESGVEVTVRAGSHGPFSFKATRARSLIETYRAGSPPQPENETVVGKLKAIDYSTATATVRPATGRAIRFRYPLKIEAFLQKNVRKRVSVVGNPIVNNVGDIVSIPYVYSVGELEPTLDPIQEFSSGGDRIAATRPLSIPITFDLEDSLYLFQHSDLGIDAFSDSVEELRAAILQELDVLWRNFALAPDEELAPDALKVKKALLQRFKVAG